MMFPASKSAGPVRWFLIGMSALLLALSIYRGFGAFVTLPIERAAGLVERGQAISLAGLERIITRFGDTDTAPLATAALYRFMSRLGPEANRAATRAQAEKHLATGLALRPVTGAGWLSLARLRHLRGAPGEITASALELSYLVSPVAPERALDRLGLAQELSAFLSSEGQASARQEARLAKRHPKTAAGFVALVARFPSIARWAE
tara:strand:- start:1255 stop:1872 length:618 start_codon:yes stop_codon:yes gene_type:complete